MATNRTSTVIGHLRRTALLHGRAGRPTANSSAASSSAGTKRPSREIEGLVRRAEEAGGDRQAVLDEIEKAVKEMKRKPKD
jgi:hypothetical protein